MDIKLALSFVDKVLPAITNPDGNWVFGIKKKKVTGEIYFKHEAVRNLRDAEIYFINESKKHKHLEIYFSLAEFRYNIKPRLVERKATQAYKYKSLGFDIDCGSDKPYQDYEEGLKALEDVMTQLGITDYLVIMSGLGLHCYILLNEIIPKKVWVELSTILARKLTTLGLKYDRSKIKEPAMLLRVPGTYNSKKKPPEAVRILRDTEVRWETYQLDELFDRIPDPKGEENPITYNREINLDNKGNWSAGDTDYKLIEENCQQIKALSENCNVSEELWYAGIGVAAGCKDSVPAAKAISINYSNDRYQYNEIEVIQKLAQYKKATTGPSTCAWFLDINEEGCKGCPHRGLITTPVQLGKRDTSNNPFEDFDKALENNKAKTATVNKENAPEIAPEMISAFIPSPYFMDVQNNICREVEGETLIISPHPIYVSQIATYRDERTPLTILTLRYKVPHQAWQNLSIDIALLYSVSLKGESLGGKLMNAGFYLESKDLKKIQTFIIHSLNARQTIEAPEKVVGQYGWTEEGSFILGNKELDEKVTTIGIAKDKTMSDMNKHYTSKGSLEQWVLLSNAFLLPDTEIHAFSLFLAFAGPLMQMSNIGACVVNLQNEDTGIGKSTMGFWGQSIYGNPLKISGGPKDTAISSAIKLGLLNNIPLYIDEISGWSGEAVSDFVYNISTGQEKLRADRDATLKSTNRWNTLVITSSNPSLYDLLDQHTATAQGQKARLFEIPFPENEKFKDLAQKIIYGISRNYGIAGEMYLKELVRRRKLGELEPSVHSARQQYQATFNFHFLNEERFIFTAICLAWLGAKIAKEIGLINEQIDIKRIFDTINRLVLKKRKNTIIRKECALEAVSQFLIQNHKNFVKVKRYGMGTPESEGTCPNESLFGRLELLYTSKTIKAKAEKGNMSISIEEFRKFCKNTKRSYNKLETELGSMPTYRRHSVNLASGIYKTLNYSDAPQLPVSCFSFELPEEMLESYSLETNDNVFNTNKPYGV